MATVVDPGQLDGLFKEIYGDAVENLVPDSAKLINEIGFSQADKLGNVYHQPVILTNEHGVTYAGPDAGAFALEQSVALTMKDAQVSGYQMLLRSQLSYDAAARASSGGKAAFTSATGLLVANMGESLGKRLEISLWYGQEGIGNTSVTTNVDATHTVVTMTTGQWATGIWAGSEGAKIDFVQSGAVVNSNGAVTIDSVDSDAKTLTVSAVAGDITLIDAAAGGSPVDNMDIYFRGAFGNEMPGVSTIIENTGTLFGIDASAYDLWRSNLVTHSSGTLTLARVLAATAKAVQRGLDENVKLFVNPDTFQDMNVDEAALRMYDSSYSGSEAKRGTNNITYYFQGGEIEVCPHNIVKEGEAYALPCKRWRRIGATDITFKNPGKGGEFFRELNDNAGFELRAYLDQAIFTECPAKSVKITGFVNS